MANGAPTVSNGLVVSGVTTSTTFSGSGASLTSLPAANLTGTLPAISGANLTNLPAQATIASNADNRVITGGSGVNLNGEAGLTYNGLQLNISNTVPELFLTDTNSNNSYGRVRGNGGNLILSADVNNATGGSVIVFESDGAERARIDANGGVGIGTINFSSKLNNEVGLAIHGSANDNCRISFTTPTKSNPGSSIGYFGLNRFGIDTYDGLEVRDVTASYATRLKIDQNGYLTLPNTPAASAYCNSGSPGASNNKIQNAVLGLNQTHYNNGGHFNTSNYRFTCPVAGYYKVSYSTNLHTSNLNDGQNYQVNLRVNGSVRHIHYGTKQSSHTWIYISFAETVSCSANDYIDLVLNGSGQLGVDSSSAWNRATFELIG